MLIIANTLVMNGGTTFILRLSKQLFSKGKRLKILCLFNLKDETLESEIMKYSDVFYLKNFIKPLFSFMTKAQLPVFLPVDWEKLSPVLDEHVHVMGVFGLIFSKRILSHGRKHRLSVGIYHQNEFMFDVDNYYFTRDVKDYFSKLPKNNVVFFNEFCKKHYSDFYSEDFSASIVTPIGIELPDVCERVDYTNRRIVSIGNLNNFKTYNKHVISLMPELLDAHPDICYEIYGDGEMTDELKDLASRLSVTDRVHFKGVLQYSQMKNCLARSSVFVGSGTAILESSALGVPSIVGVESINKPMTYGFLSDINGLTYNEYMEHIPLTTIYEKLNDVLSSEDKWKAISLSCRNKAEEFSVSVTADDFTRLEDYAHEVCDKFGLIKQARYLFSYLRCAVNDCLGIDDRFKNRRNQSTICKSGS